jgi:hypothetical protein
MTAFLDCFDNILPAEVLDCVVAESSMAGLVIGTLDFFTSRYFGLVLQRSFLKESSSNPRRRLGVGAVSRGIKLTDPWLRLVAITCVGRRKGGLQGTRYEKSIGRNRAA